MPSLGTTFILFADASEAGIGAASLLHAVRRQWAHFKRGSLDPHQLKEKDCFILVFVRLL